MVRPAKRSVGSNSSSNGNANDSANADNQASFAATCFQSARNQLQNLRQMLHFGLQQQPQQQPPNIDNPPAPAVEAPNIINTATPKKRGRGRPRGSITSVPGSLELMRIKASKGAKEANSGFFAAEEKVGFSDDSSVSSLEPASKRPKRKASLNVSYTLPKSDEEED